MTSEHEVDRLLREDGARWRAGVPTNREISEIPYRADGGRAGEPPVRRRLLLGFVALGVVVASVAVGLSLRPIPPADLPSPAPGTAIAPASTPPATDPPATQVAVPEDLRIVRPGDPIVVTGTIAEHREEAWLCPTGTFIGFEGGFGCAYADLVRVIDGRSWRGGVRIEGVWDGEAIQPIQVTLEEIPDAMLLPPIPCDPPEGGWLAPPAADDGDAVEAADRALEAEVEGHPERYVGRWPAGKRNANGKLTSAMVVGTVEDVDSIRTALTAIYPFNLCVVRSDFSAAELRPVVDDLEALGHPWHVDLEPRVGRVEVWATALSPAMFDALGRFEGKLDVHPTLVRSTNPDTRHYSVIMAVNTDTANFGGIYLSGGGMIFGRSLVILHLGRPEANAVVERLTEGMNVRWEQVERSAAELKRIMTEILERDLDRLAFIGLDTINNQVTVGIGPGGSVDDVTRELGAAYGDAVTVEFSPFIHTLEGTSPSVDP